MVDYLQDELSSRVGGATFMVDELGIMSLTAKPIEVKLYSDNLDDLNSAAQQVNDMLASIPGTKGIINDNEVNTYNYYVDMDTLKLNTLGLTKAEAQNELSYALLVEQFHSLRMVIKNITLFWTLILIQENKFRISRLSHL